MEDLSLTEVNANVLALRKVVEEMRNIILENNLEISNEVIAEIEASRNAPKESFISQEDIEAEFLDGC